MFVFSLEMMEWLCAANHVPDLGESAGFSVALSSALLSAGLFWGFTWRWSRTSDDTGPKA